ncbi:MAG: hypothetical protein KGK11_11520 [Sphingomonadales bacterium]|nr:hypothetical protein [Sphingomonadales bacterium]
MLGFGFSSGLPYALLIGTLNAWLGDARISLATIGVLSWIGLCYSFKFLWSPLVDRMALPGLEWLGRRRSWIVLCQLLLIVALGGLGLTGPTRSLAHFASFAFLGALASATQDVAIDAWRIDVADAAATVELLSAIYQLGYRIAAIVGGALALVLAARMSWGAVYALMAALVGATLAVTALAPDTPRPEAGPAQRALAAAGALKPEVRAAALFVVGASWLWAVTAIARFMVLVMSGGGRGHVQPSASQFVRATGPWIVFATVLVPLAVAVLTNRLARHGRWVLRADGDAGGAMRAAANQLYLALVAPLGELAGRLGSGVLIVFGLILSYTLCYNIWASFAFPFYIDFLHYSKDEVAFASKLFGIGMTILGIALGGVLFARIGRMPTILVGAVLPILGNFVYADLAEGGHGIDAVGAALGLKAVFGVFGFSPRMIRLLLAIGLENISTGIAGAAFVAYLSGIVSRSFTAVQYALLSSLTFLIGSLARGVAGEGFDRYGYAPVFRWTAAAGLVAVGFVLLEWLRVSRQKPPPR